jgi:hypothetical protein
MNCRQSVFNFNFKATWITSTLKQHAYTFFNTSQGTYLWGPDELEAMIGNKRVAEIYGGVEVRPDSTAGDSVVREFILNRYDRKKWFDRRALENAMESGGGDNTNTGVGTNPGSADLLDFGSAGAVNPSFNPSFGTSSQPPTADFDPFADNRKPQNSNPGDPFDLFDNIGGGSSLQGQKPQNGGKKADLFDWPDSGNNNSTGKGSAGGGKKDSLDDFFDSL